jgi:hypothetical protein
VGAAGATLPVRYGFFERFCDRNAKNSYFLFPGSSSVSQREDSPAFSSQFDGMHTLSLSAVLFPTLVSLVSIGEKKRKIVIGHASDDHRGTTTNDLGIQPMQGIQDRCRTAAGPLRDFGEIVLI